MATTTEQPYEYRRQPLIEPDHTRLPGWRDVTTAEWEDAQWQRAHCVKSPAQLRDVMGDLLSDEFYEDLTRDQQERATMSLLVTPQMLNTMVPATREPLPAAGADFTAAFYRDPIRRYMLPVFSDRRTDWASHPMASRDSLHEQAMWAVEGLTHRYPTKVLAEMVSTCPQYCGHCTRMDLVGNSTPTVIKARLEGKPADRYADMLDYLRATPTVRDVVVSGGDVANVPWNRLRAFLEDLLALESIRDIRLATKGLMGIPQHWLQQDILDGLAEVATTARRRGVSLAVHTHINNVASVTPIVAKATRALLETGVRDVRNQGVLLRGVNTTSEDLLDLCFGLLDEASVTPYYFYMCDMIPNAEHWRLSLAEAQQLQHDIMGYLPGFATPRLVCDVPYVGKRWVHQAHEYDHTTGISHWHKNYRTSIEADDAGALSRDYVYYDPIHTLPQEGQEWWRRNTDTASVEAAAAAAAAASRAASR